MYLPPHFQEDRLPVLHDAIRQARLATLVTAGADGPEANHLPMLLEPAEGPHGTLYGHLARANPQAHRDGTPALAVFLGPEAYVSPSWYATKRQTGKAVPTWNYVAVHAQGRLECFDDPARLRALLARQTERQEAGRPEPWAMADAPEDYLATLLKGIVGLRLPIERLEGKWKLSQNRSAEDRAGAVAGLRAAGGAAEAALAAAMAGEG